MQSFLADAFGLHAVDCTQIAFEYESALRTYIDDEDAGLDFGLVSIRPYYRALLEANGIVPLAEENWANQHTVEFDHHIMLGFPTELYDKKTMQTGIGYDAALRISPKPVYVTKLDAPPEWMPPTKYPRFVGSVGGEGSMDGMSGCPIFGFVKGRQDRYYIVAIQSGWMKDSRIIFGTPILLLIKLLEDELDKDEYL